jgi:hypothetical protein
LKALGFERSVNVDLTSSSDMLMGEPQPFPFMLRETFPRHSCARSRGILASPPKSRSGAEGQQPNKRVDPAVRPDTRWIDVHEDDLDEAQMAKRVKQAAALPGWVTSPARE